MSEELKQKTLTWKILNSWHILFTLPMGFLSWITFFYMFFKGRKKSWLIAGIFYLISVVYLFYLTNEYPDEKLRPPFVGYMIGVYFFIWFFSIIHSFVSLKEFWLRLITYQSVEEKKSLDLETTIKKEAGMIDNPIEEVLSEFKETDATVRLAKFLFDNLPFTPDFLYYMDFRRALQRYTQENPAELYKKIIQIAKFNDNVHKILKTSKAIDKIDGGLGIFTSLKNGYEVITKKPKERTFEADPQQAIDAGIKAIALGYIISLTSKDDPLKTFLELKAGQELLYYFIVIELALPFTDNLIESGGKFLYKILQEKESEISNRFVSFTDQTSYQEAKTILQKISDKLDQIALLVSQHIKPIEESLKNKLPSILNIADSTSGGVATILDMLPIWKFLGARVAAELCIHNALKNS